MNIIDIIILLCFIPAIINGLRKGLIAQVVSIISIILGVWMSFKFSSVVSGWIAGWFGGVSAEVLNITAFVVILIAVIFGLFALGKIIEASIKIIMLGWLNRLMGLVFSILKCFLIVGLVIIMFSSINESLHNEYHYQYDRTAQRQKRDPKEIGIQAMRGGTIVGEHDIMFAGRDEVITLQHTAFSREIFAKGAVEAAKFLAGKPAGMYDMSDVIG